MTLVFDVVGWKDWDDERHDMPAPENPAEAFGFLIHVWDDEDSKLHEYFWEYQLPGPGGMGQFQSWEDWYEATIQTAGEYDLEIAG